MEVVIIIQTFAIIEIRYEPGSPRDLTKLWPAIDLVLTIF